MEILIKISPDSGVAEEWADFIKYINFFKDESLDSATHATILLPHGKLDAHYF